jgi:NAD(P)-dependent dehydrogenase (short-subunit alcohol dehydrogenase family)
MIEHGEDGHVVTTASLAGLIRGAGPYGVSKHAVRALAETLNSDLVARGAKIRSSVLCPGFVNTNIGKSERNRPSNLTQLQAPLDDIDNSPIMALLRNGKEPSEIADIVIEAIRDDLFYILPHPAWDDTLKTYFEEILSREALNSPSLPAFLTPRDDGEKY